MSLDSILKELAVIRNGLRVKLDPDGVHRFAKIVDGLGYSSAGNDPRSDFQSLVREVQGYYKALLQAHPDDAVALNNLGVFFSNSASASKARTYFVKALALDPDDATIHKNMRVSDILTRKSKSRWHEVPDGMSAGVNTLSAHFDPQGM